jgi:TPR repeat
LDEAIVSFRRAVELKPNFQQAHRNLAAALKRCHSDTSTAAAHTA